MWPRPSLKSLTLLVRAMSEEEKPKIIVDEDWKSQAQAEKEALEKETAEKRETGDESGGSMPEPSISLLISTLAAQAMASLGRIPDPEGKLIKRLDIAKHHIDMLGVLEEKTKGNLSAEEEKMLTGVLHELRMDYVAGGYHPPPQTEADDKDKPQIVTPEDLKK